MPFGRRAGPTGAEINFDLVYQNLIAPAIAEADLEPLRADEEAMGGIIHKPLFERLVLCPYAIADLTLANANVFYELGIRHAFRPWSTAPLIAEGHRLPFDVQMLRTVAYKLDYAGSPEALSSAATRKKVTALLLEARKGVKDSPLFQLLDHLEEPTLAHEKTDAFRDRVEYSARVKGQLSIARRQGVNAIRQIEVDLGKMDDVESGVAVDLLLSYRAQSAWVEMVALVEKMARPLAETVLVREQLGLALNRLNRRDEAEKVLTDLIEDRGPSSETLGILGRVYKDRWEEALKKGDYVLAEGVLEKAIETYLRGFEADWRDAYPGVNTVTLMELREPPDPRREQLLPVVRYAVDRKIARGNPDYWDFATLLELGVLQSDESQVRRALPKALANIREPWEPETTCRNLRLIREARERRGQVPVWSRSVEEALLQNARAPGRTK